jgi:hypothetical protein
MKSAGPDDRHRGHNPLNYLVLIDQAQLFPRLYGRVLIPQAVYDELQQERTPAAVREWVANHSAWLEVKQVSVLDVRSLNN